jgi:L-amino acid N-acyltransferase YncA
MNDDTEIIAVTEKEIDLLRSTALAAYCDHYLHLWKDNGAWYVERSFSPAQLSSELAQPFSNFYFIVYQRETVGFLKINTAMDLPGYTNEETLELERIYLKASAGGSGIGSFVMNFVFQQAAILQKRVVFLKVMDTSLIPIKFYKKHGFEICGTYQLDYEQMREELRGMYFMKREIMMY